METQGRGREDSLGFAGPPEHIAVREMAPAPIHADGVSECHRERLGELAGENSPWLPPMLRK